MISWYAAHCTLGHNNTVYTNMNTYISENLIHVLTFQSRGRDSDSVGHIHQRLNDVHLKHTILLPQVQNTNNFVLIKRNKTHPLKNSYRFIFFFFLANLKTPKNNYLIILWTMVKILKGICEVL